LLTGDFNHDGKPDLANVAFDSVAVLLNDGTGKFGNPIIGHVDLNLGGATSFPVAYAVDLNGDGYSDIVITNLSEAPPYLGPSVVAVLLNNKDGTFPTVTYLPLESLGAGTNPGPTGTVALGKTTANGGIDLVSVQGTGTTILVETLLNDGAGNFPTQKTSSYTPSVPSLLLPTPMATLADVNQDGKLDLVLARNSSFLVGVSNPVLYVDILLGNGDGTFQPPAANGTITIAAGTTDPLISNYLLTASLTAGSSIPDIIVTSDYGVYIAKGNGDGTFQPATQFLDYSRPSIQTADLNSDGKLDLLVDSPGGVTTFLGNGDATFGGIASTAFSGNPGPTITLQQMVVADFNGDGKPDFAAVDLNGGIEVALGNGDGSFHAAPMVYSANNPVLNPQQVFFQVAGDFLGNGTKELAALAAVGNGAFLSASPNGAGGFNYVTALPGETSAGIEYVFPVTGDFNGDGKQDIIFQVVYQGIAVALSNGDGTFATPVDVPFSPECGVSIVAVAVGDVNGDGKLDLVAAYPGDVPCLGNPNPSGYLVALGNGDGTFNTATFTPSGTSLTRVALAAYHGPGKPLDLVISDSGIPSVSILTGNGDGTFGAPVIVSNISSQLLTDDYNQDGKPDLTLFDGSKALLYAGKGDGTFAAPVMISSSGAGGGLYVDVNNDAVPDLIFSGNAGLSVALGTGGGSFAAPIDYFGLTPIPFPTLLAGNFLGDNTQSIIVSACCHYGAAFFMNQGGTSVSVVPNMTTLVSGQSLNITVPLKATLQYQPAPTGTITLYDGSTVLSSGPVADFSFGTSQLAVGSHSIKATYSGDSHFYSNTSPAIAITVTAAAPDFTVTADPATVTVSPGQSASFKMTVAANATLTGNVTFQCSGLPSEAACTFNPASLSVAAGQSGNVALAITTKAATSAQTSPGNSPFLAGYAIAVLMLFAIPRRRLNLFRVLVLLCAVMSPFIGCGGGSSHKPPPDPGTPAGTSTVTVTATVTSGNTTVTHTSAIKLVVQ
jgi:hypothetical protein